jgi:hypothetical protein
VSIATAGQATKRLVGSREAVWLAVVVALSARGLATATRTSFFYADDVDILLQANKGLSLKLIELSYFGHFSPGHRVLDWLVVQSGAEYPVALVILFGFWLVAVLAFYAIARALTGPGFLALVTTAMFAASIVFVIDLSWYAAGGHIVTSTAFTLVALAAALRWHHARDRWAFVVAVIAASWGRPSTRRRCYSRSTSSESSGSCALHRCGRGRSWPLRERTPR